MFFLCVMGFQLDCPLMASHLQNRGNGTSNIAGLCGLAPLTLPVCVDSCLSVYVSLVIDCLVLYSTSYPACLDLCQLPVTGFIVKVSKAMKPYMLSEQLSQVFMSYLLLLSHQGKLQ